MTAIRVSGSDWSTAWTMFMAEPVPMAIRSYLFIFPCISDKEVSRLAADGVALLRRRD